MNLDLWKLLAGLGVFLFGMLLIEESVKALSGRAFRRIIRMYTNGRLRSIGSGALVTALLQSSSAVSLMVLAFVGAGVMSMENGIGVMDFYVSKGSFKMETINIVARIKTSLNNYHIIQREYHLALENKH